MKYFSIPIFVTEKKQPKNKPPLIFNMGADLYLGSLKSSEMH